MPDADALPEAPNLYATLGRADGTTPAHGVDAIAQCYAEAGWFTRRCGWTAWELRQPWAELVLEAATPALLHGRVCPQFAREATAPLARAAIAYQAELYDDEGDLGDTWFC